MRRFAWERAPVVLTPLEGTPLAMETVAGAWCVVRYLNGRYCGPLSLLSNPDAGGPVGGGFGFPESGEVGVVWWFDSKEETVNFAESLGSFSHVENRPTPREDLHFSARELEYYDGSSRVLYDGGDYRMARAAVWLRRGELEALRKGAHKVSLECRLR